jgi:hypothetical protein
MADVETRAHGGGPGPAAGEVAGLFRVIRMSVAGGGRWRTAAARRCGDVMPAADRS